MLARSRPAAHARLERALSTIHDHEGVRVTLVFDGSGKELDLRCPGASQTFSVVRSVPASNCWVATGDTAEGRTIEGLGAHWISPDDLAAWVRRTDALMGSSLAGRVHANDRNWKQRP